MKFKEIVVVEGLHDLERLKSIYPDIDVLITNGSEIDKFLPTIVEASKKRDIILFLDPDYPGERIRKKIQSVIPNAKHAFLKKDLAISKNHKKVGIEHAKKEDIIEALESVLSPSETTGEITYLELYDLGLFGNENSAKLRDEVCLKLNIGHTNGKTFLKRINMFNISIETIKNALDKR
ncbi:MAG: ribonuclease M5 [Acholeplasmatales bacterium]|nr:ribonuclease M5 [Acholeplasmatales bacterium]